MTPGRWYAVDQQGDKGWWSVLSDKGDPEMDSYVVFGVEGEANARLIAAAPALLEALEKATYTLGKVTELFHPNYLLAREDLMRQCLDAIAAARGDA